MQDESHQLRSVERTTEKAIVALKAAEEWETGYRLDPTSFDSLLTAETRLERKMKRYFKALSERVRHYVNWSAYQQQLNDLHMAAQVKVDVVDDGIDEELKILVRFVFKDIVDAATAGADAAANLTNINLSPTTLASAIEKQARIHTAELVKGINETTRQRIQDSLSNSLTLGEDVMTAANRLASVVNDTDRAELIARTESVNAYSSGTIEFGKQSGAVSKTWVTVQIGACPICSELDGQTVGLDEAFDSGDDGPPAHPNCRCRTVLNYADGTSTDDDSE